LRDLPVGAPEDLAPGRVEHEDRVLHEQRGIDVDEKSRELIESSMDLSTLNGWFRRAFEVDKASDLFEE
jgi:hypothetical protein